MKKGEELSTKNTKAELFDALQEALEREKALTEGKSDPAKEEKEEKIKKAVETSKTAVEQKIFSEELNNKFKDLEKAIEAEEEKLRNLYGIEKELQNMTVVINAGKDAVIKIENEKKTKTEELNNELEALESNYKQKNMELQKEYEDASRLLKLDRDREKEEYNYKLKREREIEDNKWNDEKEKREAELSGQEEETKKLLEEANSKVEYIKELEEKVNEIPKLLEKEYARGKNETTKELEREHEHSVALSEKDNENIISRLNDKVETLKEEVTKSNHLNELLQEKLDNAYTEIKELATRTVESTGGVKIIGASNSDSKMK